MSYRTDLAAHADPSGVLLDCYNVALHTAYSPSNQFILGDIDAYSVPSRAIRQHRLSTIGPEGTQATGISNTLVLAHSYDHAVNSPTNSSSSDKLNRQFGRPSSLWFVDTDTKTNKACANQQDLVAAVDNGSRPMDVQLGLPRTPSLSTTQGDKASSEISCQIQTMVLKLMIWTIGGSASNVAYCAISWPSIRRFFHSQLI